MAAILVEYGYNYYGKDLLMSGETGEPMEVTLGFMFEVTKIL